MSRAWLLPLALLCSACCDGPELALGAFDPRVGLEARATYAWIAPQLDAPVWAYASSAEVASAVAAHYRSLPEASDAVGALADAPEPLQSALRAVDARLRELGYQPATAPPADFVVSLSLTVDDAGALTRVGFNVGGELDGRFRPDLIGLMALVPTGPDACPADAVELAAALCEVLPERDPEAE